MIVADYYDAILLDLDGTVYAGGKPITGAPEALEKLVTPRMYVTNNASRSAEAVADALTGMGIAAEPQDVLTSAMAGAALLETVVAPPAVVLVVGSATLVEAVEARGFTTTRTADDKPAAVIHGHNPATDWAILSEAALALRAGARYVATNRDATLPAERGMMVGNGSMVAAVINATGVEPISAGKPEPAMFTQAADALQASRALGVGDRLDTDIAGGNAAEQDTLLVLTGVSGPQALLTAVPNERPTLIADDLHGLFTERDDLLPAPRAGLEATVEGSTVTVSGGDADARFLDLVHTVLAAAWASDAELTEVVAASPVAEQLLAQWW